jgi:hypothetical protein
MMSFRSLIAANLLPANSLLNSWEADPRLQSRISKLRQFLNVPFGFAVLRIRGRNRNDNEIPGQLRRIHIS